MAFARSLAARAAVPVWAAAGISAWAQPPVPGQTQIASQWCWLAVSASVDDHYGGEATQCQLANTLLCSSICCSSPLSTGCNRPGDVSKALTTVGHLAATAALSAPPALAVVQTALALGRPPVGQFRFTSGGNHVVLIAATGVDAAGAPSIRLADPAPMRNPTDVVWAHAHHYRGGVTWTHLCETQP